MKVKLPATSSERPLDSVERITECWESNPVDARPKGERVFLNLDSWTAGRVDGCRALIGDANPGV